MEKILPILKCLKCSGQKIVSANNNFVCLECKNEYPIINGVPDLTPDKTMPFPKIYDDPDRKKWLSHLAKNQDYFYRRGSLVAYVQGSGHRIIRKLRKNKNYGLTLDLACGDGAHYPYLNQPQNCFGIDVDQNSLEKLKKNYPKYTAFKADAYNLPIKDESIDSIINIYNLEHMIHLDFVLQEMMRVLKSSGEVFIGVPTEGGSMWSLGRHFSTVKNFTNSELNYSRAIAVEHINCIWQMEKALKRYFSIERRISFPFAIPSFHLNLVIVYQCRKLN